MGNRLGVVVPFRRPVSEDAAPNAAWDELMHTALRAWTWRDPEALGALADAIAFVRPYVDRDWSN
jgi:hypothetical protein